MFADKGYLRRLLLISEAGDAGASWLGCLRPEGPIVAPNLCLAKLAPWLGAESIHLVQLDTDMSWRPNAAAVIGTCQR